MLAPLKQCLHAHYKHMKIRMIVINTEDRSKMQQLKGEKRNNGEKKDAG